MDFKKMNREFRKEDLIILNQILTDNSLTIKDKNNMFYIAYYILGESTGYYIQEEKIINLFNDFYQNNKQKSYFSELIEIMRNEIEKVEYLSKKLSKPREEKEDLCKETTPYELKKEIIGRLYTTMEVANKLNSNGNISHDKFYEIISLLLFSKMDFGQNYIIPKIVQNKNLTNQLDKMKIAIEVAINTDIKAHIGNGFDITQYIIKVITEKDILNLDNDNYRKVVELAMFNIQPIVLDYALSQKGLTPSKKIILIDYFGDMMKKYLQDYSIVPENTALKHAKNIIFTVAYSKRLLSMDDKTYKETLQKIKNSNKPFSYAEIESSDKITDEQRKFVISLIEKGIVRKKELEREFISSTTKPSGDYKQNLAYAAISPNALKLPYELYKKVMVLLDLICQKAEDAYQKEIKERYSENYLKQYHIYRSKQQNILELLNNENLFNNNIERLIKTIEAINSNNLSEKTIKFSINEMSIYYTDEEFNKAISILQQAKNTNYSYEVFDLLTNKNIPFMEDKNGLFNKVLYLLNNQNTISEDFEHTTKELNKEGTYNMNMSLIFNGVKEEIIKSVTRCDSIKIRKLKANN